ncbi:hypothetical protein SFUMM280S_07466 [Streptomyces fumanus]
MAPFVAPYLDDAASRIVDAVATAADGLAVTPLQGARWPRWDQPGGRADRRRAQRAAAHGGVVSGGASLPDEICRALDDVSEPVHRLCRSRLEHAVSTEPEPTEEATAAPTGDTGDHGGRGGARR